MDIVRRETKNILIYKSVFSCVFHFAITRQLDTKSYFFKWLIVGKGTINSRTM